MKTGSRMRVPSKIFLLKDLAGTFWMGGRGFACEGDAPTRNLEIVKELNEPLLLSSS
jgi:hypothetical protein